MKNINLFILVLSLTCFACSATAQYAKVNEPNMTKPKLFQNLPTDIVVSPEKLSDILNYEVGQTVNINLSPELQIQGQVVSTASKYENSIQSIVIAATNYNGARLTLSKLTNAEKQTTYRGRIISFQHGDLFELTNRNNQYSFIKKNFYDLVSE